MNRRQFFRRSSTLASGGLLLASATAQGQPVHTHDAGIPGAHLPTRALGAPAGEWATAPALAPVTLPPLASPPGQPYRPVITPNGTTLPWEWVDGVKQFHLVAEPVLREFAPGMVVRCWGYNGRTPGPTLEAVEGDRVRILVTNGLPEHTTVHWHGQRLPNGMDGVGGVTQPHIAPGKTMAYEFTLRRSGTFMYHPHSDEMVQIAMGMMGMFVVHPRDPSRYPADRDYCFTLQSWKVEPGSYVPNAAEMLDFNLWSMNSRTFPGIDPLVVRQGDRVRIRLANLTMTNHPMHLHGHEFVLAGTDGGWIPTRHAGRRSPWTCPWAPCGSSSLSPTNPGTGPFTATSPTTPWAPWATRCPT